MSIPFRSTSPSPPAPTTQQGDVDALSRPSPLFSSTSTAVVHGPNVPSSSSVQPPPLVSSYPSNFRCSHIKTYLSHGIKMSTTVSLPLLYDPIVECLRAGQWNGYVRYEESKERSSIMREEMRDRSEGQQEQRSLEPSHHVNA